MLKYIEAIQCYSRECAEQCPNGYDNIELKNGLDESDDLAITWMLSKIYGREFCEVEHDLIVYTRIYINENDNG